MEQSKEQEFSYKINIDVLLKFHPLILTGVSLASVICYFTYFRFNIEYLPSLSGSDVFYFGGLILFGSFLISLLFIMPSIFYPGYHKNKKPFIILLALSILPLLTLICEIALLNIPDISLSFTRSLFISFMTSIVYVIIIGCIDKFGKVKCIKVPPIFFTVLLVVASFFIYNTYKIEKSILFISTFLMIGFVCAPPLFLLMSKDIYNNNGYKWLLASMAIAAPIYSSILLASSISSWLEISNVNYKYLIVEKSVLDALPVKKCEANEEYEKTCYKTNGVVKLYNIKALSTLGKFYYLETKDKVRFELDASKIISREKQER